MGLFDAVMLVMGGTIGSGIFITPYVVAQRAHTAALVMGAWVLGGVIALIGALIWAELADRMPRVGGQYAYLREVYHPLVAFLYGWVLLLVVQTGGMAVVTMTFAKYFLELAGIHGSEKLVGVFTILALTIINCLGVRAGGTVQSALMVLKIAAILLLVGAGAFLAQGSRFAWRPVLDQPASPELFSSFGAAMVPVLFAYGGWQTACFVAGELKEPRQNLPRALVLGVIGVALLYTAVNFICVRALGVAGLAQTSTPASAVMRLALGERGATIIALGIAISTLGFLSQSVLTAPRVYFAMAEDGVFFRQLAWVHPSTRVPVVAITLQSLWTVVIMFSGRIEQILNYVTSMDFTFFTLTASCLFLLRRKGPASGFNAPGHPWTTGFFCICCAAVVATAIYQFPKNTLIGFAILATGVPVYYIWKRASQA
ncbi:MAG TPA: amino acid permease [Terriglobales bacterium]|nr:amino acid permease [Terriglobales bacterium]